MAGIEAKVNMSLDEIIKLGRKDKKKRPAGVVGKAGAKKNVPVKGNRQQQGNNSRQRGNSIRGRAANKTGKQVHQQPKSQAWRLQRHQLNGGFVSKKNKQPQNGGLKRSQSKTNLKKNLPIKNQQQKQINNKPAFAAARRPRGGKVAPVLTRPKSRTNLAPTLKRFLTTTKGLKRTNSMPNLRDPLSVHNRLGYQSPAQVAYRNRVKRAKQLLLQRQSQRLAPNNYSGPRPAKTQLNPQQRALDRRQQHILTSPRPFNTGGLRSDQIIRAQRQAQYKQKLIRMNAARVNPNPNVNFMCTLGDSYNTGMHQRSLSQGAGSSNNRQRSRGRSPFRPNQQSHNSRPVSRGPFQGRPRSRSRSRSRSRNAPVVPAAANVDDRSFSEVMYSVSNNLGITGRTLNDRFSY